MPIFRRSRTSLLAALAVALAALVPGAGPAGSAMSGVKPHGETEPVLSESDAADDIAIWRHPQDPAASLVFGTDKRGDAVEVYDLDGKRLQRITGARANGIDLRRGVDLGQGPVDLVAVGGSDIRFFRVDPDARRLVRVEVDDDGSRVDPNGVCLYRSPWSGRVYLFGINLSSVVDQLEVVGDGGRIDLVRVRDTFDVGSDAEACVADDGLGHLYVNEADEALWKYGAEPDAGKDRTAVDRTGSSGHLDADVEGLTIVYGPGESGYLFASSQGDDTFTAYRRGGDNEFLLKFEVEGGDRADGCSNTDGIDALWAGLGPDYPQGIFVCQDHHNGSPASGNQNFKFVRLEKILALLDGIPAPTTTTTTTTTTPMTSTTTTTTTTSSTISTTSTTAPRTTSTTTPTATTTAPSTHPSGSTPGPATSTGGYWMVVADGTVHAFGSARHHGDAALARTAAADLEPHPDGAGYWILERGGRVHAHGGARWLGDIHRGLPTGEEAVSLSATPTGQGYWIFTDRGRAVAKGDARFFGDMSRAALNGPVLDSVPTPTGRGYYMVAADGGIFSFGDARFAGSMGGTPLNAPVQSLVPDGDGDGYWLVAADGGVFAFDAPFRGSMGGVPLNRPVTGMVPYGGGYLMVAADGGIFNFSNRPFAGSLGASPPPHPVVAVAARSG